MLLLDLHIERVVVCGGGDGGSSERERALFSVTVIAVCGRMKEEVTWRVGWFSVC